MRTALLVLDCQQGTVKRQGAEAVLVPVAKAIAAARQAQIRVIFVRTAFRFGFPEVSSANQSFQGLLTGPPDGRAEDSPTTSVHQLLERRLDEPIVVKKRVSAFTGSDLEVMLRSSRLDRLVLCGISTSGVVLSTVREAADRDYQLVVLSDACWDSDTEVQRVLTAKVFPRQAVVMTVEEWSTSPDESQS